MEGKRKGKKDRAEWERHEKMITQTERKFKRDKKQEERASKKGRERLM